MRHREATAKALETVKKLSNNKFALAYTSEDAKSFGIVASTNKSAASIRSSIDGNASEGFGIRSSVQRTTGLLNGDSIFVVECGQDFSENGYGKLLAWFQHN